MLVSNPFTNDPRVYSEAKSLIQSGYKVTVIAYDWQKQNPPLENVENIHVIRFTPPLIPRHGFGGSLCKGLVLLWWQLRADHQVLALIKKNGFEHPYDVQSKSGAYC